MKNKIKYLVLPNVLFEELGYTYLGTVDGHDISAMERVLEQAKKLDGPVVIHALTKKGKGYEFAEQDPEKFHGISKFEPATGETKSKSAPSNSAVFASELIEIAKTNDKIVAITAAMPSGTGLDAFEKVFPQRFFDVGIAEEHAVTMAAGMACSGVKPVVAVYSSFLQRAYDQIVHDVCLQDLPVIFAIDRAGLVGEDGETHHGVYDMSFLGNLPGMTIMSPASQQELRAMLRMAAELDSPCAIRYNRGSLPSEPNGVPVEYGKWQVINAPAQITLIAQGRLVESAVMAAEGLDVGLINARFIKPIDRDLLDKIFETSSVVITVEDGIVSGGLGSAVRAYCGSRADVVSLGITEAPILHASIAQQDEECGISVSCIRNKILSFIEGEKK